MNAFVKKEIRLLLPTFLIGCALAFPNLGFRFQSDGSLANGWVFMVAFVFSGAVAIMLALNSFGAEISSGTFSNLLAQPISRQKIWDTKIALLAGALTIIALCWSGCGILRLFLLGRDLNLLDLFTGVGTFGLVVFSGGLWTVLLLRQVAAAFWFTLLVPGVLLMIVAALFGERDGNLFEGTIISVLGLYSLVGFFFARWLFFRAQDVQWSGGTIVIPQFRGNEGVNNKNGQIRRWQPRAALWRKEFLLHQSPFVMAFVLLVLHLGVLVVRHFLDLSQSHDLKITLESFWGLWLVMPLLVGCAAVAEERKLGTLESQLCQPVKRRTQFVIKFSVALILSVLLGEIMPVLLEGTRLLPDIHSYTDFQRQMSQTQFLYWNIVEEFKTLLPLLIFAGIASLIGGVSFYVSSLARNTLQTLAPAVMGILLMFFLLVTTATPWWREYDFNFLWRGPLAIFIAVPFVLLSLLWLTFQNFQHVRTSARIVGRNVLTILFALLLGALATSAVYHRGWEKFTAFEPAHGPAKFSLADGVQLNVWWAEINVRLPDGIIWTARFGTDESTRSLLARLAGKLPATLVHEQFYRGSNWMSLTRYGPELAGIKADGTLWISEAPMSAAKWQQSDGESDDTKLRSLVQFGVETNWCSVCQTYLSALLVKTDGTMWRLGTNKFNEKHNDWPGLRAFTPYRLGTDSGWKKTSQDYYHFTLQKTNDSIWIAFNNYDQTARLTSLEIEQGFSVVQIYDGLHGKFRSTTQIQHGLEYKVGIREDGTFRIWADMSFKKNKKSNNYEAVWSAADGQIGSVTNWLALAGGGDKVVTLKSDGTLWLWDFQDRPNRSRDEVRWRQEVLKTVPVQLGTHSDWLAVSGHSSGLVALAADGSLWFWPVENAERYFSSNGYGETQICPLLDISRKPQLLGNIFGLAK